VLLFVVFTATMSTVQYLYTKQKATEVKSGYYNVVNYRDPGMPKALTDTNATRWQKVMLTPDSLSIYLANGVRVARACNIDAARNQFICFKLNARETDFILKYKTGRQGELRLRGDFMGHKMVTRLALLSAYHPDSTLLLNRGFHWVNEVPFNK